MSKPGIKTSLVLDVIHLRCTVAYLSDSVERQTEY